MEQGAEEVCIYHSGSHGRKLFRGEYKYDSIFQLYAGGIQWFSGGSVRKCAGDVSASAGGRTGQAVGGPGK